jgi:hypothetical protein
MMFHFETGKESYPGCFVVFVVSHLALNRHETISHQMATDNLETKIFFLLTHSSHNYRNNQNIRLHSQQLPA